MIAVRDTENEVSNLRDIDMNTHNIPLAAQQGNTYQSRINSRYQDGILVPKCLIYNIERKG